MSNYPPGVSGHEWQIAGYPSEDVEIDGYCEEDDCHFDGPVSAERQYVESYGEESLVVDYWTCPNCGYEHDDEHVI